MRISFITLGCKLNQAETSDISDELKKLGHLIVPFKKPADIAVIRACAVTQNASQATRGHIRRAKRGGAFVIAGGCLENRDMPEIDYVAETAGDILKKIVQLNNKKILRSAQNDKCRMDSRFHGNDNEEPVETTAPVRTRAFIKIQDGCKFNCAYCVVPRFRGKSRSVPASDIIRRINLAQKTGCHEVILTGVNICQYHAPTPSAATSSRGFSPSGGGRNDTLPLSISPSKRGIQAEPSFLENGRQLDLVGLIKKILLNTKIERIRLGSLDPRLISDELIKLFSNPRLMPHWHLSLQSGSDAVLTRMNRGYSAKHYAKIVDKIRRTNPLFSITTDIIVGFPGETEKEFLQTIALVKKIKFAKVHVFPYSPRPMTMAAAMKNIVQDKIKTERVARLIATAEKCGRAYARKIIGKIRPVLFESVKNHRWFGHSPEYLTIIYRSNDILKNVIVPLKIRKTNLKTGS